MGSVNSLKIAIIGQSTFAVDVMQKLIQHGHSIVGVFTVPDKGKREDPLGKLHFNILGDICKKIEILKLFL